MAVKWGGVRFLLQGAYGSAWKPVWLSQLRRGECYWHPMGGGQGCCAQHAPHTGDDLGLHVQGNAAQARQQHYSAFSHHVQAGGQARGCCLQSCSSDLEKSLSVVPWAGFTWHWGGGCEVHPSGALWESRAAVVTVHPGRTRASRHAWG